MPSHTQQTPQQTLPPAHPQSLHASHHPVHLQSNPAPAPTPQSMLQQAQQHPHPHPHPPPQQQQHVPPPPQQSQSSQPLHHLPHHPQAPTPAPHHVQHHPPSQPQHLQSHPPLPPSQTQPHPPPPSQQLPFARVASALPNVDSRSSHYPPVAPLAPPSEAEHDSEHTDPVNEVNSFDFSNYVC